MTAGSAVVRAGANARSRAVAAILAALALAVAIGTTAPASAGSSSAVCRAGQTDRAEHRAPDVLLSQLGRAFAVPAASLRGTSFVRCAGGRLMACMTGANLNCGRANASRHSQGGDAFCHDNPGAVVVPMAATGHDSVYDWHCQGSNAVAGPQTEPVDDLGFMSRNWRFVR